MVSYSSSYSSFSDDDDDDDDDLNENNKTKPQKNKDNPLQSFHGSQSKHRVVCVFIPASCSFKRG